MPWVRDCVIVASPARLAILAGSATDQGRTELREMKNIQIIDGAKNCTFSIFEATDEDFAILFPEQGQEIQFSEDLAHDQEDVASALRRLWEHPIRKRDAHGIHGTLFYGLEHRKSCYREKREDGVDPSFVNAAQRRLFGL
jgi:hypothetical protein